jgi:hypothetical protein
VTSQTGKACRPIIVICSGTPAFSHVISRATPPKARPCQRLKLALFTAQTKVYCDYPFLALIANGGSTMGTGDAVREFL